MVDDPGGLVGSCSGVGGAPGYQTHPTPGTQTKTYIGGFSPSSGGSGGSTIGNDGVPGQITGGFPPPPSGGGNG